MKKNSVIILVILALFLILMADTNPSKADYIKWTIERLKENNDENILVNWGVSLIAPSIVDSLTTTNNYVFFSTFTAEINDGKKIIVLGVLKKFFVIK